MRIVEYKGSVHSDLNRKKSIPMLKSRIYHWNQNINID